MSSQDANSLPATSLADWESRRLPGAWSPWWATGVVFVLAFAAAWQTSEQLVQYYAPQTTDVWFDSDLPTIRDSMVDRWRHSRSSKHPLFSALSFLPVRGAQEVFGLNPDISVRVFLSLGAGLWISLLFRVLLAIGLGLLESSVFTSLAAVSGASVLWSPALETFSWGAASMLLVLLLVACDRQQYISASWYLLASACSLSITVTNWMAGLLATFLRFRPRSAIQISANALCLVVVLFSIQKVLIPSTAFFLGDTTTRRFVLHKDSGGIGPITRAFFAHSLVLPQVEEKPEVNPMKLRLSAQHASLGSGSSVAWVALGLWAVLLAGGAYRAAVDTENRRFVLLLGGVILGQFALHSVFGAETLLYSLHYLPLLVILAAFSARGSFRWAALGAATLLVVLVAWNNALQFHYAVDFSQRHPDLFVNELILDKPAAK